MAEGTAVQRKSRPREGEGAPPAIALRGLERDYGERTALRDVSLELAAGETLAVLGPNGAGKTTLLRVLATLLRPTRGEVTVLGHPLPAEAWRVRGRIGFLGHDPLLYRDLTVAENLRFQARLHRQVDDEARIASLLERVELSRRAGERVRDLSAGMVQRVAVCRAVLHQPELLLLDEPRSHLDPEAAALTEPLIGAAAGVTRVVVTHDVEGALADADLILALRANGSVAYVGRAGGLSVGDARAIYRGGAG